MTHANDNHRPLHHSKLGELPLFASDREIAEAIVGKVNATRWLKDVLPTLEGKGFPPLDRLHLGRPVHLVMRFYERVWFGIEKGVPVATPDGEERLGQWKGARRTPRRVA